MKKYLVAALKLCIFACQSDMFSSFGGAERKCFVMKSAGESPAMKGFTVLGAPRRLGCWGAWWSQHDAWMQWESSKQTARLGTTEREALKEKLQDYEYRISHQVLLEGQAALSRQHCGSGQLRSAERFSLAKLLPGLVLERGWCGLSQAGNTLQKQRVN